LNLIYQLRKNEHEEKAITQSISSTVNNIQPQFAGLKRKNTEKVLFGGVLIEREWLYMSEWFSIALVCK